jgi:exodeoxyribonuclease VII small subunit
MAKNKGVEEEKTFEDALLRLETIVEQLERGDVPLEESIKLYEEGIQLSRVCAEKLNRAELTIKKLAKDLEGNFKLLDMDDE